MESIHSESDRQVTLESGLSAVGYCALSILFTFAPWCVASWFMSMTLDKPLPAVTPVWNDELVYWHGILTFLKAGFNGGYYTFDEYSSPLALSHFDPHGPVFFVVMAFFSLWGQWTPAHAVYTNMVVMAAGAVTFLGCVRPCTRQLLCGIGVLATCWYAAIFLPMTMQECFQTGLALAVAGILGASYYRGRDWSLLQKVAAVLLIALASFTRPLWAFSLLAFAYLWTRQHSKLVSCIHWIVLATLVPTLFFLFTKTSAPYPEAAFVRGVFGSILTNPFAIIGTLIARVPLVFRLLGRGLPIEIATRQETLLLFAAAIICIIRCRFTGKSSSCGISNAAATTIALSFGSVVLLLICIHDIFDLRDYRAFSPHLLCALMFLVACRHYRAALLAIAFHITVLPSATESFGTMNRDRYTIDYFRIAHFAGEVGKYVRFDPNAPSGWCNTVLTQAYSGYAFPPEVAALPAGVGFSVLLNGDQVRFPIKSRFLLIDQERVKRFGEKVQLQSLVSFGQLTLYRNVGAQCG